MAGGSLIENITSYLLANFCPSPDARASLQFCVLGASARSLALDVRVDNEFSHPWCWSTPGYVRKDLMEVFEFFLTVLSARACHDASVLPQNAKLEVRAYGWVHNERRLRSCWR